VRGEGRKEGRKERREGVGRDRNEMGGEQKGDVEKCGERKGIANYQFSCLRGTIDLLP
jgi:hypothetical protein